MFLLKLLLFFLLGIKMDVLGYASLHRTMKAIDTNSWPDEET